MLRALEIRQHVLERPAGVAELAPMVEILGLAANIDHAVDRRRAAQHLAARPEHSAIGRTGVGFGLVAPVDARIGESLAEAQRDVNPAVRVLAAGLDQHDAGCWVFAKSGCHRAAGGPGPDDDEISLEPLGSIQLGRHLVPFHLSTPAGGTLAAWIMIGWRISTTERDPGERHERHGNRRAAP